MRFVQVKLTKLIGQTGREADGFGPVYIDCDKIEAIEEPAPKPVKGGLTSGCAIQMESGRIYLVADTFDELVSKMPVSAGLT